MEIVLQILESDRHDHDLRALAVDDERALHEIEVLDLQQPQFLLAKSQASEELDRDLIAGSAALL